MRVRGLKFFKKPKKAQFGIVAPHAGAWIEINLWADPRGIQASHPMRVRGLKFASADQLALKAPCRTPCGCVD